MSATTTVTTCCFAPVREPFKDGEPSCSYCKEKTPETIVVNDLTQRMLLEILYRLQNMEQSLDAE